MKSLFVVVSLLMFQLSCFAQTVPPLVNYQGRVANPDGSALNTANYQLIFNIYDAASGGGLVWGPQVFDGTAALGHGALIPVVQGYFNVMLGPVDVTGRPLAGAFNASNRFIEVTVTNHPPISPRQQVLASPFAFQTVNSATLAGSDWSAVFGTNDPINGKIPGYKLTNGLTLNVSNLTLPATTATIYSGASLLVRADGQQDFFAGPTAGNTTGTGTNNTGVGYAALSSLTSGYNNTALGNAAMDGVKAGHDNTGTGYQALSSVTSGNFNTASGSGALETITTASDNTANGYLALASDTTGSRNTAVGYEALTANTSGNDNTAMGLEALFSNLNGAENTAVGYESLLSNTNGSYNVATGYASLYNNLSGNYNTANGFFAMYGNTNGTYNTAVGIQSLYQNATGDFNVALGGGALFSTTGNQNIAIGFNAGENITFGGNNIVIGHPGATADTNIIRIGSGQSATYIAGIFGATAAGGLAVYVSPSGQLGVFNSSARFKENIASMADSSSELLSLHPVTFNYRPEIDPQRRAQFGLVAEEVAKVDPNLVVRDDQNQIYSVRYEAVNAMLLNEFIKEHRTVQEQKTEIRDLKTGMHDLQERLEAVEKMLAREKSN